MKRTDDLKTRIEAIEADQKRIAKGLKRAEEILEEECDGEILVEEKCTIAGVEFDGT